MILYKYFPAARLGILQDRLIRFTQPTDFNDPFDSTPAHLTGEEMSVLGMPEDDCCTRAHLDVCQKIMSIQDSNSLGVLCLSERPDSLLMWSHYADRHHGFVIGFDVSNQFLVVSKGENILREIRYGGKRRTRAFDKGKYLGPVTFLGASKERLLLLSDWVFSKSAEWSYEQEWRMVRWLEGADTVLVDAGELPVHLYRIVPAAIHSVIIGCRGWSDLFPKIQNIINLDEQLDHVRLIGAHASDYNFEIILSGFPSDDSPYRPWSVNARQQAETNAYANKTR
jgi:hypothetical protein